MKESKLYKVRDVLCKDIVLSRLYSASRVTLYPFDASPATLHLACMYLRDKHMAMFNHIAAHKSISPDMISQKDGTRVFIEYLALIG